MHFVNPNHTLTHTAVGDIDQEGEDSWASRIGRISKTIRCMNFNETKCVCVCMEHSVLGGILKNKVGAMDVQCVFVYRSSLDWAA